MPHDDRIRAPFPRRFSCAYTSSPTCSNQRAALAESLDIDLDDTFQTPNEVPVTNRQTVHVTRRTGLWETCPWTIGRMYHDRRWGSGGTAVSRAHEDGKVGDNRRAAPFRRSRSTVSFLVAEELYRVCPDV